MNSEEKIIELLTEIRDSLKKPETKKRVNKFSPPTVENVTLYCTERANKVDANEFIDHYTANGWMRGKVKIKDWRACVRTWEKKAKEAKKNNNGIGAEKGYPPNFDPSKQCNSHESYETCKIRAWREHERKQ